MHLFDVQAFWLIWWWQFLGCHVTGWWTDSYVAADAGTWKLQLRYFPGICRLWCAMIPYTLTVKEKQPMGSHNCPSRNRTPLFRRRISGEFWIESKSQNIHFGFVRIKHRTVPKNHPFWTWDSFMADVCLIWLHPLILHIYSNGKCSTLHEPTQSSSFALRSQHTQTDKESACIPFRWWDRI